VLQRIWYWTRWLTFATLCGGLLFQSACATALTNGTAGLLTSISDSLISNYVQKAMGIESFYGLGT